MVVNGHSKPELYLENPSTLQIDKRSVCSSLSPEVIQSEEEDRETANCSKGCCANCSKEITNFIEKCFYSFGCNIGKRPWLTIILSVCLCLACSAGNVFWQVNSDTQALWTPYGSPVSLIKTSLLSFWYPYGMQ